MSPRILSSGSLDSFNPVMVTPVIGNEFPKDSCNIVDDILQHVDRDQQIRDLAVMVAERGVVFFRSQTNLSNSAQKTLITLMGSLTTRPPTHGLHIHPVTNDKREFGDPDPQISTISSEGRKILYKGSAYTQMAAVWHSDIAFENAPADFSSLRLTQLPTTGGDTLWASGYENYDRNSGPYRRFLEGLTATFVGEGFRRMAESGRFEMHTGERGAPVNVGKELVAVHPGIGGKDESDYGVEVDFSGCLLLIGSFASQINGLSRRESKAVLQYFNDLVTYGHDLQVRFKWNEPHDIAIWDNRSVFHTATGDHEGHGSRSGNRAVGVGEVPYFNPESKSRREELGLKEMLASAHL
ncbi:hypothetical protein FE257_003537 [Aspergillus nanangensis]|uniref:TauD/TfdA-like domain-containing protein n=1 Tax=Aspergillus nanangensis TaxID=2582783 RepID=A0AAD4CBF4_ASPNN|nr:hypothetical protein FE257_003537 [Aspergillus nanangensis]